MSVLLTSIYADGPGRDKLTLGLGHAATLGCYWCCMPAVKSLKTRTNGHVIEQKFGAVRYIGYVKPVTALTY